MASVTIRRATVRDCTNILGLVNHLALSQVMLPRSPASVLEGIRDFVVAEVDGEFAGCGALHVVWSDHAEIRSIAVAERFQSLGLGRQMAEALIREASDLGIARVFAFTYVQEFFEKLGFEVVEHETLPHKVFSDCMNCPKFTACDEIAVVRVLDEDAPISIARESVELPRRQSS